MGFLVNDIELLFKKDEYLIPFGGDHPIILDI